MLNKELLLRTIALFMTRQEALGKLLLKVSIQQKQITQQQIAALLDAGLELFPKVHKSYSKKELLELLTKHNVITKQQRATANTVFSADSYRADRLLELIINNKLITKHDVKQVQKLLATAMKWSTEENTYSGGQLLRLLLDNQLLTKKQIITLFNTAMTQIKKGEIAEGVDLLELVTKSKHITQKQIDMLFTTAMTWLSEMKPYYGAELLKALINNKRITKSDTEKVKTIRDSALKLFRSDQSGGETLVNVLRENQLLTAKDEEEVHEIYIKSFEEGY